MFRKKSAEPTIRNLDGTPYTPKVEWVTAMPGLVENYPIIPARMSLPQWFKDSPTRVAKDAAHSHGMQQRGDHPPMPKPTGTVVGPKTYWKDETPTVRHCPGIVDVMRSGYLLRAWTDIEINTPEPPKRDGTDRYMDRSGLSPQEIGGKVGAFGPSLNQKLPLWEGEYEFALKFDTPWLCKTPPGYSLLYLPVPYAEHTPFRVLHGITDNDTFHIVNILAMWSHHGSYLIEAGTPLCWLLPVKRDGYDFPTEVRFDAGEAAVLRSLGKGGAGTSGGRIIHNSYMLARSKARKDAKT